MGYESIWSNDQMTTNVHQSWLSPVGTMSDVSTLLFSIFDLPFVIFHLGTLMPFPNSKLWAMTISIVGK